MLGIAILFFILAGLSLLFGFSGVAGAASEIAWILLIVFAAFTVLSLLARVFRGKGI
ncbi:MAG: DUF1328 domain-containing protein [Candidatus Wildermuthbacteria bacterium]|nr:DUF1328 domain-containing protein [Candidatus Wildermuthbacteria bacterium]